MNNIEDDNMELVEDEVSLRRKVSESEDFLGELENEFGDVEAELEELAQRKHEFVALEQVCRSLEELDKIGAAHLFWEDQQEAPRRQLERARGVIDEYSQSILSAEERREALAEKIGDQNFALDSLHYELAEAIELEENRKGEWVVERDPDATPIHAQIMPWSRGYEEDTRFRKSLASSLVACGLLVMLVGSIAIPIAEKQRIDELPERVAKLVRQQLPPPPPPAPVEEPLVEEEIPEPEPEPEPEQLAEVEPTPELVPETVEEPTVAVAEPDTKEEVKSKGILAFRDSFASRASLRPAADLGSQARVRSAGEETVGRTQRAMVTTNAPGSSGGINLADISRDVGGGGGQGMGGVEVTRVVSSIGSGGNADRPMAGGGISAGRTDEEIQIVFDRYKAALYRLYNRELRKNPTLRGQVVLKLTIEPDGSVSFCALQSTDMAAPELSQQVVERVGTFDFGAKEDIAAVTIIYPIDFLPAV